MAKDYVPTRRDELLLLPPDVRDWLPKNHLVWFLLDVIERMDTSVLHRRARLGGAGRAPYDPEMLFGVLLYSYASGLRSSRKIEKRCREDTAFMVLSGLCYPDHVTIARFRGDYAEVMDELFDKVLVLCVKAGLGTLDHVAIDGTKIAANAATARTRDVNGLRGAGRRWLNEAARVDAEEDARFGDSRGDELPEELRDPATRQRVIDELLAQADADVDRQRRRARRRRARQGERALALADELQDETQTKAEVGLQAPIARVQRAEAALERARRQMQARADDRARRDAEADARGGLLLPGRLPLPVEEQAEVRKQIARVERDRQRLAQRRDAAVDVTGKRNLTDPDARFMPVRGGGFVLGYNAQLAVSADHLILDYDVVQDPNDINQLIPIFERLDETVAMLREATGNPHLEIGTALLDAGYDSDANLTAAGPDRVIALGKRDNIAGDDPPTSKPDQHATARQKMAWRLSTPEGKNLYKKRGATVEPVNGHLKDQRGLRRFSRRGKPAAKAELALAALANNIMRWFTIKTTQATETTA
ncbi:MAG TPA: transposase [Candidatus Binatia bacterium]|nr:transposase [Candidatus Binatia bacterium]